MVGEGFGSKLITAAYSLQPKMIILGVSFLLDLMSNCCYD